MQKDPDLDPSDLMDALRARGLRMTPQRRAIVAEIMRAQGHISPAAVTRNVQRRIPGVNASTVYRTIRMLEDIGVLSHAHLESGPEYHRAGEPEHVHLVCSRCGRMDDLSVKEAKFLHDMLEKPQGFAPDLTHFAISGLCAACR